MLVVRKPVRSSKKAFKFKKNKIKKEPITVEKIETLYEKTIQHRKQDKILSNLRNFLTIILGFSGSLRFSELASLRRWDIVFC